MKNFRLVFCLVFLWNFPISLSYRRNLKSDLQESSSDTAINGDLSGGKATTTVTGNGVATASTQAAKGVDANGDSSAEAANGVAAAANGDASAEAANGVAAAANGDASAEAANGVAVAANGDSSAEAIATVGETTIGESGKEVPLSKQTLNFAGEFSSACSSKLQISLLNIIVGLFLITRFLN